MADAMKHVVITGASDGLGLRLAHLFADENTQLLLTGRKNRNDINHSLPPDAHYLKADQSDPLCSTIIKDEIARLGWEHIDNLVLNAGTGYVGDPIIEDPAQLRETLEVNLITPINLVGELSQLLGTATDRPQHSSRTCVTFIGSTAAKGAANFASYAASKAGISGFVRALASEWQDRAHVQIIHPGPTKTAMHAKAGLKRSVLSRYFIDPDFAAQRIMKFIDSRKARAKIGILENQFWILRRQLSKLIPSIANNAR